MELSRNEDNANTNMLGADQEEYEKIKVHYVCGGKIIIVAINSNSV